MLISPALSAVKQIAAEGKYHVLPVSCEMLSDFTTTIEAAKKWLTSLMEPLSVPQ